MFRSLVNFTMLGSMAPHRQRWCWRGTWEFYIWFGRHQDERDTGSSLTILKPQFPPLVTCFLQNGHTSYFLSSISHSLMKKYLIIWAYEGNSYSNHHIGPLPLCVNVFDPEKYSAVYRKVNTNLATLQSTILTFCKMYLWNSGAKFLSITNHYMILFRFHSMRWNPKPILLGCLKKESLHNIFPLRDQGT